MLMPCGAGSALESPTRVSLMPDANLENAQPSAFPPEYRPVQSKNALVEVDTSAPCRTVVALF